jgi:PIN domain nuclease of toxin-antitoxin system
LVDTQILIWAEMEPRRLSRQARTLLEETDLLVSVASVWEMSIKIGAGKLRLARPVRDMITSAGFDILPITLEHANLAGTLPWHHRDPFDRMLAAQALIERLTLITADEQLLPYGDFVQLV